MYLQRLEQEQKSRVRRLLSSNKTGGVEDDALKLVYLRFLLLMMQL